jgi:RNA polymerase sigma-70 factor (ECF subfamily)
MADQPEADHPSALATLDAVLADARPHLLRLAQRMCGSEADAEDLLQKTFERAVTQGLSSEIRNTRAWLTAILKNAFIDDCRAKSRHPSHEPITDQHDACTQLEPDGPEPPWSEITVADVRDALDELEPIYRQAYVLHEFEHRSYEQIARAQNIERVTVGTRLNRARKKLREVLLRRFKLEDPS